jgi:hypothetical protein
VVEPGTGKINFSDYSIKTPINQYFNGADSKSLFFFQFEDVPGFALPPSGNPLHDDAGLPNLLK